MKTVTRKEWADALRSGDYRQGSGSLYGPRSGGCYCCLGVACSLAGYTNEELFGIGVGTSIDTIRNFYEEDLKLTPLDISNLISMNDAKRMSFNEIANYIDTL